MYLLANLNSITSNTYGLLIAAPGGSLLNTESSVTLITVGYGPIYAFLSSPIQILKKLYTLYYHIHYSS